MTTGIAAALDPSACAFTLFNSNQALTGGAILTQPFVELLSTIFAGEPDEFVSASFLRVVQQNQVGLGQRFLVQRGQGG